jgi:uncharacterized protein
MQATKLMVSNHKVPSIKMQQIGRKDNVIVDSAWITLSEWFRQRSGVIVLVSGGVDSSLLLVAAKSSQGQVIAVTADSPSLARNEIESVKSFVAGQGVKHILLTTDELDDERYVRNSGDRCYYCKKALYRAIETQLPRIMQLAPEAIVVDGTNKDDLRDHRPSLPASQEHGILHPYVELQYGKTLIREMARAQGLPMWNKPAMACLSSRIQEGVPVSIGRLSLIEQAERIICDAGFWECRVRYHESGEGTHKQRIARIELPPEQLSSFALHPIHSELVQSIRALGFHHVTLDLEGYKRGGRALP